MSLVDDKRTLRSAMLAWRGALPEDERRAAADGLLATLRREKPFESRAIVSGFWPIKDEIDIRPLMIELFNSGSQPVSLTGWELSGGIHFNFTEGTTILPGQFLVIAKNPARRYSAVALVVEAGRAELNEDHNGASFAAFAKNQSFRGGGDDTDLRK